MAIRVVGVEGARVGRRLGLLDWRTRRTGWMGIEYMYYGYDRIWCHVVVQTVYRIG
jgi:hypothetical protein